MRKVEIPIFKFDELAPKVQDKILEYYRSSMIEINNEQLYDVFKEKLSELGYPTGDIRWSLSYSQGDGMAFYGKVPDPFALAKRLFSADKFADIKWDDIKIDISQYNIRYHHYNSMDISIESYSDSMPREFAEEFHELVIRDVRKTSKELEKFGYEFLYPKNEEVLEFVKNLDEEYFADGSLWIA